MPIYEYRCEKCGVFEVTQRITEPSLKRCPTCKRKVERLMSRSSFVLKGSGWYATDYASSGRSKTDSDASVTKASDTKAGDSKSNGATDSGSADSAKSASDSAAKSADLSSSTKTSTTEPAAKSPGKSSGKDRASASKSAD